MRALRWHFHSYQQNRKFKKRAECIPRRRCRTIHVFRELRIRCCHCWRQKCWQFWGAIYEIACIYIGVCPLFLSLYVFSSLFLSLSLSTLSLALVFSCPLSLSHALILFNEHSRLSKRTHVLSHTHACACTHLLSIAFSLSCFLTSVEVQTESAFANVHLYMFTLKCLFLDFFTFVYIFVLKFYKPFYFGVLNALFQLWNINVGSFICVCAFCARVHGRAVVRACIRRKTFSEK